MFRKNIEPSCAYCKHGIQLSPDRIGCHKRGVVPLHSACSKFTYNPLKRQPERPRKLPPLQDEKLFQL